MEPSDELFELRTPGGASGSSHAASRRTGRLLNTEQLAEDHVNHASALGEDDAETRSGASRYCLQDHSITSHPQVVKALKLILKRLRKRFGGFDGVQSSRKARLESGACCRMNFRGWSSSVTLGFIQGLERMVFGFARFGAPDSLHRLGV